MDGSGDGSGDGRGDDPAAGSAALFVYGTLKRACRNHPVLRGASFLGEAHTEADYLLHDCGSYPGLVRAAEGRPGQAIQGELYRVDEKLLKSLDAFEDAPREFVRDSVRLQDGLRAEAYFYCGETDHLPLCGAVWKDR